MDHLERETGQYPLSIGTSLALEGLFNVHPVPTTHPAGAKRVRWLWVNGRTLIRNLYASMTAELARSVPLDLLWDVLVQELESLRTVVQQQSRGHYGVEVYLDNHDELKWLFPHALYKQPHTEKQRHYATVEALLTAQLIDATGRGELPVKLIKRQPAPQPYSVALLTHYPHELLWRFQFESLFLLESHTGKLKSSGQWGTKLHTAKHTDRIPFNAFTLQLFGDGTMFDPFPKKLRDEVIQIADARRWTKVTSLPKCQSDIKKYAGEALRNTFAELMKHA